MMHGKRIGLFGDKYLCDLVETSVSASSSSNRYLVGDATPAYLRMGKRISSPWMLIKEAIDAFRVFKKYDALCFIYVGENTSLYARLAKLSKTKVIYFWIGTDVYELMSGKLSKKEVAYCAKVDLHLADGDFLSGELADQGIKSSVAYIVPSLRVEASHMPKEHGVLLNIPDARLDFYNYPLLLDVVRSFPNLKFIVVRSEQPELYEEPNIDFRGKVASEEMARIYDDVSIILRFPEHDSLSLASMEGIARGKWIISRFPFPTSIQVADFGEIESTLRDLTEVPPVINQAGIEYYNSHFTPAEAGDMLLEKLDGIF